MKNGFPDEFEQPSELEEFDSGEISEARFVANESIEQPGTAEKIWNTVWPWIRIGVSIIVIAGLFYISGIYQYVFYRRTPANIEQEMTESVLDIEMVSIPLTIIIIESDSQYNSSRSKENAMRLVENASRIWQQANIQFSIKKLVTVKKTSEELAVFFTDPEAFIRTINEYDYKTIHAFLIGTLNGINGIAFTQLRSVAVADFTTVYDFRTFAHEVGHILGLPHVDGDKGRLMYRGANGFMLTPKEVIQARKKAEVFL